MGKESSVIETGVDKLVELIRAKKKIAIPDAAKQLGVGPVVVEEWADFLEEEGIISIEYKFATPYLVERRLTEKEVKEKEKEFHSTREGFIRKAEVALVLLDKEGEDFQKFKDDFEKLKKDLGSGFVHVEDEMKQLEKIENLKRNVDSQLNQQQQDFQQRIIELDSEMNRELRKYKEVVDNINFEVEKLDKQRLETLSLRQKEIDIKRKIDQFQGAVEKINGAIKQGEANIEDSEKKIRKLKKLAEKAIKEIAKWDIAKELKEKSKEHRQEILKLQQEVLDKTARNQASINKAIEDGKASTKKFRNFFTKKQEIEKMLKEMDKQKAELEQELVELIKKAKAFHLSNKSSAFKTQVRDMEKKFEDIAHKKQEFEKSALRLSSVLKS